MCLKIYHLDPAKYFSAPGLLALQAALKKIEAKLKLLTHIDILLMVKTTLEEEYFMQFINMQKQIINKSKMW